MAHGPAFQGEAIYTAVTAGKSAKGQQLGPGKWALHTRSTVPFVRVNIGAIGTRNLTWGEIYEIPEGHFGNVLNASFHDGDIVLAQTSGGEAPPRPTRITIAAPITEEAASNFTAFVDTRMARAAFLAVVVSPAAGFTYTVLSQAPTQGAPISPTASAAKTGGILSYTRTVVGPLFMWPLGYGSGEYLDPAGNTVPEYRPMSLLDRARVDVLKAQAELLSFDASADAFYVLEY